MEVPHLHTTILPLVPCPFWERYPSDWSQVPLWGGGVPQLQAGGPRLGVPHPGVHLPAGHNWSTPWGRIAQGEPPRRIGLEYPQAGQDWGTSPPPPETEHQRKYLLRGGRYASCVHAGCCLVLLFKLNLKSKIYSPSPTFDNFPFEIVVA